MQRCVLRDCLGPVSASIYQKLVEDALPSHISTRVVPDAGGDLAVVLDFVNRKHWRRFKKDVERARAICNDELCRHTIKAVR